QREARKAQSLAHPNVVTVFDFDRDGGTVFMTMEYLEGESLDKFNKRHEGRGVPVPQALELIEGLSNGLAYAHQKGVVHSDFKPANAFLTKDGRVKVFDFGIARAAKRGGQVSGEKTLFDAASLGALTPAYASCEMLEGKEPDPRDDVYALACVSYELIAGRHPFEKIPAATARDRGLVPQRISSLNGRQWRGLKKGLAFDRNKRTHDVRHFLAALKPRRTQKAVVIGVVTTLLLIGALGVLWLPGYLERQQLNEIVEAIQSGDQTRIDAVSQVLPGLSADARASVFLEPETRSRYVQFVGQRIESVFSPVQEIYDYPAAKLMLDELNELMPDSVAVAELEEVVSATLDATRLQQQDRVRELLDAGILIPQQGSPNVVDTLATLKQMDPGDTTDQDALIPLRFAASAASAFEAGDLDTAEALVEEGLRFAPEDAVFTSLSDRITLERNAILKVDLESRIQAALPEARAFDDFAELRPDFVSLLALDPDSEVLTAALSRLRAVTSEALDSDIAAYRYGAARQALERVSGVLPEEFVQSGFARVNTEEARGLAALVERVEQSVAENPDEPATLDEILAGLEKNNADKMVLLRVRDAAAGSFVDLARQAIADGDTV
ncbi:MAG: serine/threonine-protein kinase, partial [Gammaproteobacteria bacterium]